MVSLRWSDILLVGGILLLFVFTPSVVAGGLGGPEAVEGADFRLAPPKEGEVLVYSLTVRFDDRVVFDDRRAMTVSFGTIGPVVDGYGREREALDMAVSFTQRIKPYYEGPDLAPHLQLARLVGMRGDHVVSEIDAVTGMSLFDRVIGTDRSGVAHRVEYQEHDRWRESGTPFLSGFRLGQDVQYRREPISREVNQFTQGLMEVVFDQSRARPLQLEEVAARGDTLVFGRTMTDLNVRYGDYLTLDTVANWNGPLFGLLLKDDQWTIVDQEKQSWWSPDVPLFVQNRADATLQRGETTKEVQMTLDLVGREVPEHARELPVGKPGLPRLNPIERVEWVTLLQEPLPFEDARFPYSEALRAIEQYADPVRERTLSAYEEPRVLAVQFAYEGTVDLPTEAEEMADAPYRLPRGLRTEVGPLSPRTGENLTWWIIEGPADREEGDDQPGWFFLSAVSRIVGEDGRLHSEAVYDAEGEEVGNMKVGRQQFRYGGYPGPIRQVAPLDHLGPRALQTAASHGHDLRPDSWLVGDARAAASAQRDLFVWLQSEGIYLVRERGTGEEPTTRAVMLDMDTGRALLYHETGPDTNEPPVQSLSARSVRVAQGEVDLIPVTATAAAGAGVGLLLVLGGLFARFGALLKHGIGLGLIVPLYAKIMKSEVLENERRERVMEILRIEPGLSASDVKRRLGYGWGTVVHHLETLRRNGLVSSVREGHRLRWFAADVADMAAERSNALLANPRLRAFVEAVQEEPGADLAAVAERLGLGRSITSDYGRRLEQAGLVRKERAGRRVRFYASA